MQNVIERALILTENDEITPEQISLFKDSQVSGDPRQFIPKEPNHSSYDSLSLDEYLVHFLKNNEHLTETELAKQLGISRKTLWEKRQRLNIPKKGK